MLPKVAESIGFLVVVENGNEKILVCWSGTVIAHVHCETVRVLDHNGDIWLVLSDDDDFASHIGVHDVTWYYAHARPIPRMHILLQSAVVH